jgi:small subunit ribosomal protein S16
MVRLRLTRIGTKKKPYYRLIATDSRAPRDGRVIERLGWHDPRANPPASKIDLERVDYWLGVGALPSETVASIIARVRAAMPPAPKEG